MGAIPLPIPCMDFHRAGHPPAFAYGQPETCPICVDTTRQEREFGKLEREHRTCCSGALLLDSQWVNVIAPVDSPDYRPFAHEGELWTPNDDGTWRRVRR